MPPDADPGLFIVSDGRCDEKPKRPKVRTLRDLFSVYREALPKGAKEDSTVNGERIHISHLLRHLKSATPLRTITTSHVQHYVTKRLGEHWRNKPIRPDTIKKELSTLRLVWNWALNQGHLECPAPTRGVTFPKTNQELPFMTWDEIETITRRGGLTEQQERELWNSLYLNRDEIDEVLEYAKQTGRHGFIFPMFVFAAHTGARRSEIIRSKIEDFDFSSRTIRIREKKRSRVKALTFRYVDMTPLLFEVMESWFQRHPGGQFTLSKEFASLSRRQSAEPTPLSAGEAHQHFKRLLRGTKWQKIRGFHVFRHSFASNAAASGVDQRIIDAWMGHQTEEMCQRYRHLFPEQRRAAIESVFGRNGQ